LHIGNVDDVTIDKAVLEAMSAGNGFEDGHGTIERVNPFGHHFTQHVIFFAAKSDGSNDCAWCAADFSQFRIEFGTQFINRQTGGQDLPGFQEGDGAVRWNRDFSTGRVRLLIQAQVDDVARSESQTLLPGGSLRRTSDVVTAPCRATASTIVSSSCGDGTKTLRMKQSSPVSRSTSMT